MRRTLVLLVAFLLVAAVGCSGSSSGGTTIDADMKEFSFTPDAWTVPAGATVTLQLSNSGSMGHEWVILTSPIGQESEFEEDLVYWEQELEGGESGTFTFTAPSEPGTYQVICAIPGHFSAGMKGTLTVTG